MKRIAVAVPSWHRAGSVKVLAVCPWARVYADESEADEYRRANPGADVVEVPIGVQGNICRIKNYILDAEFDGGADAVCVMDDDISDFGEFVGDASGFGYNRVRLRGDDFGAFLERNTALCEDWGLTLWGVNFQAANRLYHQGIPFSLTKTVLGPFYVHLRNPIRCDVRLSLKDDFDLFLQHMRSERAVLRVNAAWYVNGGTAACEPGGTATYRNVEEERRQFALLREKWGGGIVRSDATSRRAFDFNPRLHVPIPGA